MKSTVRIAVVGLGKMGLSHFAMVNAHPATTTIACEGSKFLADVMSKNTTTPVFRDYEAMLRDEQLDAVVIATPSRSHASMVRAALAKDLHVFCEKPFCLDWHDSKELTRLAEEKGRVAQVGYHHRYVGAFREMKRILDAGALGRVTHVLAEAYGPVVLRSRRGTWRSQKSEGGGCLLDYAAHPLNLLNWIFGVPAHISGSFLSPVFSDAIDDQVTATLQWTGGPTAQLSVNWSDESHRKMSTKITMIGTNGRLNVDRQECQLYLREPVASLADYGKGWTVRYTTDLTEQPWFYLRGEEYSTQLEDFISAILAGKDRAVENDFASATQTDRTLAMVIENAETGASANATHTHLTATPKKRRLFGSWLRKTA
jgi:predicted dehydrogenase